MFIFQGVTFVRDSQDASWSARHYTMAALRSKNRLPKRRRSGNPAQEVKRIEQLYHFRGSAELFRTRQTIDMCSFPTQSSRTQVAPVTEQLWGADSGSCG